MDSFRCISYLACWRASRILWIRGRISDSRSVRIRCVVWRGDGRDCQVPDQLSVRVLFRWILDDDETGRNAAVGVERNVVHLNQDM